MRNVPARYTLQHAFLLAGALLTWTWAQAQQGLRLTVARQNATTFSSSVDYADTLQKGNYQGIIYLHHDHLLSTNVGNNPTFIQLYLRSDILQFYTLKKLPIKLASWIESDQYLMAGNQRVSAYGGVQCQPLPGLQLMPLLGYSLDQRGGQFDRGFSPALRGSYRYQQGGLEANSNLFLRTKYIAPRYQHNILSDSRLVQVFNENARIETSLRLSSNQMEDYKRSSIEKIRADTILPTFILYYVPYKKFKWQSEISTAVTRRSFRYARPDGGLPEFNTLAFNQSYVRLRQEAALELKRIQAQGSYLYEQTLRRYSLANDLGLGTQTFKRLEEQEQLKDFVQRLFQTDLSLRMQAGHRHSFDLTYQNRYIQYDTPSEANYDDHDELSHTGLLLWNSKWRSNLSTTWKLQTSLRHYVFLFAQRTQENYTQRNLRLEFNYTWKPISKLSILGEQFIYVTYNVKDFPDYTFTNRSTRTLENRIKANYQFHKRLNSSIMIYRKEIRASYLNWEKFAETPLDTALFVIAEWLWNGQPLKKVRIETSFGYRHFVQWRYQNTSMTALSGGLKTINLHIGTAQTGPVTALRWQRFPHSVSCEVWWQWQRQQAQYSPIAGAATSGASWREADLQPKAFVLKPFVQLQLNVLH